MPDVRDDFDLFDDVFDNGFDVPMFNQEPVLKTDVVEKDGKYIMKTDLPGFAKNDVKVTLENGTLSIHAARHENKDEKDKKGKVLRRERRYGSYSRSFYVGNQVKDSDVNASYKDGVLTIELPAKEDKKEIPEKKYIAIE
ncbi:MAG: Hsp20/alpha crystallin family protein [Erysipelotrichaceae bacterium]|nr:Hsp20/alpha crystallin family protein [Lactimicrobium massiliense]MCH4019448.1 Hsp20/alpha crystallin family protein [Erysipelotrichaceae bacterium]MCI1326777.1 Hsp20/alpha crystallin family protein [Solobacterium sp.]MCH4045556.1 Hsp20/alpha crystallin family protein [Erysipelotrichaceae bacterium]MCH4122766.1 Hsp20/alpha crystallin family protein [Erysipelotrichaceae bacterium]MCI1418104.1 Hsp20/alpha crystallin family protein [Solobacterium sp.]